MSRRGELASAAFWALLGGAVTVASWRMDRLSDRAINPWSAPGLTPGVVGALMLGLAVVLAWRALRRAGAPDASADEAPPEATGSAGRTLLAAGLCVLFALSLGRGLPFAAEAATFVFLFTSVFSWPTWRAERRVARGLAQALAIAVVAALAISWLFESVFLVRLP